MPAPIDGLQPKRPSTAASEVAAMSGSEQSNPDGTSKLPKAATRPLFTPTARPPRKKRPKKPLLMTLLILALVGGGVYAYMNRTDPPKPKPQQPAAKAPAPVQELTKTLNVAHTSIKLSSGVPQGLDIDQATGYVYTVGSSSVISGCKAPQAASAGTSTLHAVDPAQAKELFNVATESAPVWPQVDNGRKVVYVAGSGNGMIGLHNLANGQKISTIDVKGKPQAFGFNAGTLMASNTADSSQTYYSLINPDTRKVVASYKVPEMPHGIAFNAADKVFYMVGSKTGDVAVIDAVNGLVKETLSATGGGGENSQMVVYSPKLKRLYISDQRADSQVSVYDIATKKVIGKIRFTTKNQPAWGMQLDDERGLLYAALPLSNAIAVADASTLKPLGLIKVDECPFALDLDLQRGLGFSTSQVVSTVSSFKIAEVLKALGR